MVAATGATAQTAAAAGNPSASPASPPTTLSGSLRKPWLLADIGGTNARFGWVADSNPGNNSPGNTHLTVQHVATLASADHAGPEAAAAAYLAQLAQQLGAAYSPPQAAAFAVATAVQGDTVAFTNSSWAFSRRAAQQRLGLGHLAVLNDFEALALALPHLRAHQLRAVGAAPLVSPVPRGAGALAVIGPGTGLGVAGLVPAGAGWAVVPGEGGHASLAAADDFEAALLAQVRRHYPHVSAERLLSGIGLPVLHQAVAALLQQAAPVLSARDIVSRAVAAQVGEPDPVCSRTISSFCALLGSFAGNVALTLGARGGVFIGGGIVPRLGELFFQSQFRQRFEAKGRFQPYLAAVPVALITDTLVALTGAACALDSHHG
jgi:glucokinase